jgi:hypothetical protein
VVRTPEGKDHSEFPAIYGSIILKLTYKKRKGMDWTNVAWDGNKWWAFMKNVMKFQAL